MLAELSDISLLEMATGADKINCQNLSLSPPFVGVDATGKALRKAAIGFSRARTSSWLRSYS